MVKPIPIFEFAFAAYAATAGRGDARLAPAPQRPPFMQRWNSVRPRGDLLVKVELRDDERSAALAGEQSGAPASKLKEIWLGDIAETSRGFSGSVRMAQEPLTHVRVGQRIVFDPSHILDWAISFDPSEARAGREIGDKTLP